MKNHLKKCSDPISADPICPFPKGRAVGRQGAALKRRSCLQEEPDAPRSHALTCAAPSRLPQRPADVGHSILGARPRLELRALRLEPRVHACSRFDARRLDMPQRLPLVRSPSWLAHLSPTKLNHAQRSAACRPAHPKGIALSGTTTHSAAYSWGDNGM